MYSNSQKDDFSRVAQNSSQLLLNSLVEIISSVYDRSITILSSRYADRLFSGEFLYMLDSLAIQQCVFCHILLRRLVVLVQTCLPFIWQSQLTQEAIVGPPPCSPSNDLPFYTDSQAQTTTPFYTNSQAQTTTQQLGYHLLDAWEAFWMFLYTNTERHKHSIQSRINLTDKMKKHVYANCELVSHNFIHISKYCKHKQILCK